MQEVGSSRFFHPSEPKRGEQESSYGGEPLDEQEGCPGVHAACSSDGQDKQAGYVGAEEKAAYADSGEIQNLQYVRVFEENISLAHIFWYWKWRGPGPLGTAAALTGRQGAHSPGKCGIYSGTVSSEAKVNRKSVNSQHGNSVCQECASSLSQGFMRLAAQDCLGTMRMAVF